MERLTVTPFAGRMDAACLMQAKMGEDSPCSCGKWAVFDDLRTARAAFGVSDRDLAVLWALLSFLPGPDLSASAGLVVFPSNAALSDRTHGMAESTLRRHLAALVAAGLIARHDSPNGKRYARRGAGGVIELAFGFDLSPLLRRAEGIAAAAHSARQTAEALSRAREAASLRLRDARQLLALASAEGSGGLAPLATRLAALTPRLRRRMSRDEAERLEQEAVALVQEVAAVLESGKTDGSAAQDGRQHTESNDRLSDSGEGHDENGENVSDIAENVLVPLFLVTKACPEIALYAGGEVRRWHDLEQAAARVRPMMGISRDAWDDARAVMGDAQAAMVLAAVLQRSARIRSPGGYLRHLTRRAAEGRFRPAGMILSLLSAG